MRTDGNDDGTAIAPPRLVGRVARYRYIPDADDASRCVRVTFDPIAERIRRFNEVKP